MSYHDDNLMDDPGALLRAFTALLTTCEQGAVDIGDTTREALRAAGYSYEPVAEPYVLPETVFVWVSPVEGVPQLDLEIEVCDGPPSFDYFAAGIAVYVANVNGGDSAIYDPARHARDRLEYLRGELRAERISMGELHELQSLREHIAPDDLELREAAGIPEHEGEDA